MAGSAGIGLTGLDAADLCVSTDAARRVRPQRLNPR